MKTSRFVALVALMGGSLATYSPSCETYKIPVTVTSKNNIIGFPPFETDFDVAAFIEVIASRSAPPPEALFSGQEEVTATYSISGTFCRPAKGNDANKQTVLIATHGVNFDGKYWDPKINDKYNFVKYSLSKGYSIFFYDRLGVGESQKVSGYIAQLSNQVAILRKLTSLIKEGKYTNGLGKPKKVVLVGHSLGSAITSTAAAFEPGISDGLVLTGFSLNLTYFNGLGLVQSGQPRIAAKQNPAKWRKLDTGYVTPVDIYANVVNFFKKPFYEVSVAKYADANKQPIAIGELVSGITDLPFTYKGAVLMISGKYDYIWCKSDCETALDNPGALVFSQAKVFKAIVTPDAGHGLNFHINAVGAFKQIFDFLAANGL